MCVCYLSYAAKYIYIYVCVEKGHVSTTATIHFLFPIHFHFPMRGVPAPYHLLRGSCVLSMNE
jgi:hypothetical protein